MAYIGRDTDKISNVEVLDNITFDGSSSYTLQKGGSNFTPSSANTLLLSIDGVVQAGNFTVSGSTIDFGTAVAGTSTCDFVLHYGVGLITSVSDGTVTTAKLGDSAVTTAKINDNAITLDKMASGTDGNIISYDASGNPVAIATGNDGQVLTSAGAGQPPAFEDVSGGVTFIEGGTNFTNSLLVGNSQTGTLSSAQRNTGVGKGVFNDLTSGIDNISLGYNCLTAITSGVENVAIGSHALDAATTNGRNIGIGHGALGKCTSSQNVAVGDRALDNVTTGTNNIAIGSESGAKSNWLNWTTESNRLTLGNIGITNSYVRVDWTIQSDIRDKTNIGTVPHGIDFVKDLNPISYKFRTARGEDTTSGGVKYGFSAQDILALETANGGSNVIVDNEFEENLSLTSSYLIPVLVNAIKQQQTQIETLETKVTTLETQRADLEARLTALENA